MKKLCFIVIVLVFMSSAVLGGPKVRIKTNKGSIIVELNRKKAPVTVKNFLRYVKNKKYDGTIFHRVIKNFMIQGGGFTRNFQKVTAYPPIRNEAYNGLKNYRGKIAMARTRNVNSATNQFFINTKNNPFLDHVNRTDEGFGYCVFGKVIKGLSVVDKIQNVSTGNMGPFKNVPKDPVIIKSIRRVK